MLYALLRFLARLALRWFYRDISTHGLERVPRGGALLLVVNHPNALVDALVVGATLDRRLMILAKSTIFVNPLVGAVLRALGVIPLRRASDERRDAGAAPPLDPSRNAEAFRAVLDAFAAGQAVLIFPEGKSHDEAALAPLRSGAARMALQAAESGDPHTRALTVVPVGLTFERKEAPRSRVHVEVGAPLRVREWLDAWTPGADDAPADRGGAAALTREIERRLHAVTLNYASIDDALRERDLAALFAAVLDEARPVGDVRPLDAEVALARRIASARALLGEADPPLVERTDALLRRVDAFDAAVAGAGVTVDDVAISTAAGPSARFALREGALLVAGGPLALWGRVHHWLPFRLAFALGETGGPSRDQPAMRTILAGLVLVLLWYAALWVALARVASPLAASLYVASLPVAEDFALRFQERMARARRRMRAWSRFRRDPALQRRLCGELAALREEAQALERALGKNGEAVAAGR